jgi:hypothetical protein
MKLTYGRTYIPYALRAGERTVSQLQVITRRVNRELTGVKAVGPAAIIYDYHEEKRERIYRTLIKLEDTCINIWAATITKK